MESAKIKKITLFLHFFAKIFGHIKKKQYLCTRFREGNKQRTKAGGQTKDFPRKGV